MLTVILGVSGIVCSLPLGILLALGRQSKLTVVRTLSICFIEFMRGVPLITLLFVASSMLNYFLPPGTNFSILVRVIIMFTFFSAAYIAEVIRGGIQAIPKGQYEAADALGMTYWQKTKVYNTSASSKNLHSWNNEYFHWSLQRYYTSCCDWFVRSFRYRKSSTC